MEPPGSTFETRLQAALGPALKVEKEIGGGGMSRVFLAHDGRLDRDVVVKVLHPELASEVSASRFNREIQLAARLQHPHVVPIIAAGEVDGLPYFTMPYVAGESLRQVLRERGALPIDDVVSVLRDVARALDYAHSLGVVHRDIKPDNVLLSRGTAAVTDFGVAKAVSAARIATGSTLTSIGTSIGTPAYMAPEQAAGDPAVDHRADIYALGAMAYELIAGRPPFTHTSAHRLMTAHVSEVPAPVITLRPECSQALSDLVMWCLEKDPAQRPQSAAAVLHALNDISPSSGAAFARTAALERVTGRLLRPLGVYAVAFALAVAAAYVAMIIIDLPDWVVAGAAVVMALGFPIVLFTAVRGLRWRRTVLGGVIAMSVFAAGVATFMILRAVGAGPVGSLFARGVISASDRLIVADFTSAEDTALGPVISEGVRTSLRESRAIGVLPTTQVAAALRRMQLPHDSRVTLPLARQIAEREGAKAVLDGSVTPVGDSYIITLRLYGTADSAHLATVQETAAGAADIIPAVDRVSRRLREKIGESFQKIRETPRLENATTASLPALRKFTEGWRANTVESDWNKAIAALEEAVRLDSTFAIAWRQLWAVYSNAGIRPGRADTALEQAFRHRERLGDLERNLIEGAWFGAGREHDRRKSIPAYERALEADSTSASALNSLGLIETGRRNYARADSLFARMQATNPGNVLGWTNRSQAQLSLRDSAGARRTAEDAHRRFPTAQLVRALGMVLPGYEGGRDSLRAVCEAFGRDASLSQRRRGAGCLERIALATGRLRDAWQLRKRRVAMDIELGEADVPARRAVDSLFEAAWFLGQREPVVRALDGVFERADTRQSLAQIRVDNSDLALQQVYYVAAATYALAGRPDRARALLADYVRTVGDTFRLRFERNQRDLAEGIVASSEGRHDTAIRLLQRADTAFDGYAVWCDVCSLARLAYAYDAAGRERQAIETYERYLAGVYAWRTTDLDPWYFAGALKRLGELYEAQGDAQKGAEYLRRFIALWSSADPELMPAVMDARRRLARIEARKPR